MFKDILMRRTMEIRMYNSSYDRSKRPGNGTFRTLVTGRFGPKTFFFSRCEKKLLGSGHF